MREAGSDVVVIGGGIVGTAAAAFLAEAGARVTLVERDGLASGASGANSGVVQHPFDPVLAALYRETLGHVPGPVGRGRRLPARLGAGRPAVRVGGRGGRPARRPLAGGGVPEPRARRRERRGPATRSNPRSPPGCGAVVSGSATRSRPAASTYAYATIAERRGVRVRMGRTASLDRRGDAVVGVVVDGERVAGRRGPRRGRAVVAGAHRPDRRLARPSASAGASSSRSSCRPARPTSSRRPRSAPRSAPGPTCRPTARRTSSTSASCRSTGSPPSARPSSRTSRTRRRGWSGSSTRASAFVPAVADAPIRGTPRLRAAAEPRWSAAHRPRARRARPVHLRRSRRLGDLDRSGVGAARRRRDPRALAGHPGRARPGRFGPISPGRR